MGDVNFREKINNNGGVIMDRNYSTAKDGITISGSSTIVYDHLFLITIIKLIEHEEYLSWHQRST